MKGSDFWSRRMAAVKAEAEAEKRAEETSKRVLEQEKLDEKTDEEILAELKLPDPDTLQKGDDFSGFLAKAVPLRLQRRALRRLWLSDPVLANLDELVEYGEDFTDAATVVENLQTAYQVGKGMLEHVEKMAEAAARAESDDSAAEAAGSEAGEGDSLVDAEPEPEDEISNETAEAAGPPESPEEEQAISTVKRRMRFKFSREGA